MKKFIISAFALVFILGIAGSAQAATATSDMHGWGWSSTIGWISFDSHDDRTGPGGAGKSSVDYGVTVSTSSDSTPPNIIGTFHGQAWSPNVGWIYFDNSDSQNVSGCGSQAVVNLSTGVVTGWARAVSGTGRTDGWDGCIKLSDNDNASPVFPSPFSALFTSTNGKQYGAGGITFAKSTSNGVFDGFSWGSVNVGWLSFKDVTCPGCVGASNPSTLSVTCVAPSPSSVTSGSNVTITANVSGGTAPYKWNGSPVAGLTSTSTTINNYTVLQNATFTVIDSFSSSGSASCPGPTVTGGGSYTLTVNRSGPGTVSSVNSQSQANISCGLTCSAETVTNIPSGTSYTFTTVPSAVSNLTQWGSGACASASGNSCTVVVDSNKTVNVSFSDDEVLCPNCGGGTGEISLLIGKVPGPINKTSLTIPRGNQFKLSWYNASTTAKTASCSPVVVSTLPGPWTISRQQQSTHIPSTASSTSAALRTTSAVLGTYTFQATCDNGMSSNTVDLTVYSGTVIER